MKCKECNRGFPVHLINPMCINGEYISVCPICALKIRNKIHGLPEDEPFTGTIANQLYEEAVEYLKSKWKVNKIISISFLKKDIKMSDKIKLDSWELKNADRILELLNFKNQLEKTIGNYFRNRMKQQENPIQVLKVIRSTLKIFCEKLSYLIVYGK